MHGSLANRYIIHWSEIICLFIWCSQLGLLDQNLSAIGTRENNTEVQRGITS